MGFSFAETLLEGAASLGLDLSSDDCLQLEIYFNQLKKWQKKVNLIAKSATDQQIVENHFLDSLILLPCLGKDPVHLLDIGTGGGFPGLVCGAACDTLQLSLVEPRLKRVSFLKHIVRTLGLQDVTIHAQRLEDVAGLADDATISHITCRAVTEIGSFLNMVEDLSPLGARVMMMKGPRYQQELAAAEGVIRGSSFSLQEVIEKTLPYSQAKRYILVFDVT